MYVVLVTSLSNCCLTIIEDSPTFFSVEDRKVEHCSLKCSHLMPVTDILFIRPCAAGFVEMFSLSKSSTEAGVDVNASQTGYESYTGTWYTL